MELVELKEVVTRGSAIWDGVGLAGELTGIARRIDLPDLDLVKLQICSSAQGKSSVKPSE